MTRKDDNPEEKEEDVDEFVHQNAAYFCICCRREFEGLFCDIEELDVPPYVGVRLELPLQSAYTQSDVEEMASGMQSMLFLTNDVLIRYHIIRDNQEEE